MSTLVGDKLYETVKTPIRSTLNVEELKASVEFPDVRRLINEGRLSFRQVLALRQKASRFRSWLQTEADRDRDAIIAYHQEVSQGAGFTKIAPRALQIFGVVAGGAIGGAIGGAYAGPVGGAVGNVAGVGVGLVANLGESLAAGWKPVVFGNWMSDRITEYVKENTERRGV